MKKHTYGWIPDVPDHRDFTYQTIKPRLQLPLKVDLRPLCSLVEDQGQLGSCTANALAGNLEFLDNEADKAYDDISRLFIYYNERVLMGTPDYDSGATLRIGIKTLVNDGACAESLWPYKINQFSVKPLSRCYVQAKKHRISSYHRLENLDDMLVCLAEGYPFVFGFSVYESFESQQVAQTGIVPMPKPNETLLGGHAVTAVGYDQKSKYFIVRNSWGQQWGQEGYCLMPFDYMVSLARDFWTIRK